MHLPTVGTTSHLGPIPRHQGVNLIELRLDGFTRSLAVHVGPYHEVRGRGPTPEAAQKNAERYWVADNNQAEADNHPRGEA
jgi:hypothetical protein